MDEARTGQSGRERHDRLLREWVHDPYKSKRKLREGTVCRECGAVFAAGRWQWLPRPADGQDGLCPACHRQKDHVPAGILTLRGPFLRDHREEILHLIRNLEEREKSEHPLKRIMSIEEGDEEVVVTFTDPHLARGAGEALEHAYHGDLDYQYVEEDVLLRVHWQR